MPSNTATFEQDYVSPFAFSTRAAASSYVTNMAFTNEKSPRAFLQPSLPAKRGTTAEEIEAVFDFAEGTASKPQNTPTPADSVAASNDAPKGSPTTTPRPMVMFGDEHFDMRKGGLIDAYPRKKRASAW
eukprot:comp19091_c0_seq1/m.21640 comp19091_c0_seq1/g.21640  ORF comp19091_c0_seq1/g.21640 comp19091_c0_seq1/m.21640 type:complete len:129 (-) comp19091_c0_seq1:266-652(-)